MLTRRNLLKALGSLPFVGSIPLQQVGPVERFGVISDTHQFPYPVSLALMNALKHRPVDFVIVAGDVCEVMCGPEWIFDCVGGSTDTGWLWTRQQLDGLGKPWAAVPGNHDLISQGGSYFEPVSSEALALWGQYVGALQFTKETEYCQIVGINYLQWDYTWMSQELATEKRKIVVSHIPLFGVTPLRDQDAGAKIDFLLACGVELFICGHSHQFSVARIGGLTQVVCPPVSYTLTPDFPQLVEGGLFPVGIPARGWLEVEAGPGGLTVELWRSDGLRLLDGWGGCMWLPWVSSE
jgi:3',5'-cyclic AMP phosphodiesterase CpdA